MLEDRWADTIPEQRESKPKVNLSWEDRRVLTLVAEGYTQKVIAEKIGRAGVNMGDRLARLYRLIGAKNAPNAVAIAIREGYISARKADAR